jgi:hypothetical protein
MTARDAPSPEFSRFRGVAFLLCPHKHDALAGDAFLKFRDGPIGLGKAVAFVEHAADHTRQNRLVRRAPRRLSG